MAASEIARICVASEFGFSYAPNMEKQKFEIVPNAVMSITFCSPTHIDMSSTSR